MPTALSSITRAATRQPGEPLNILCGLTHERYETGLAKTGHNFYAFGHDSFKPRWATEFAPIPDNYVPLNKALGDHQIPNHLDLDLVLSQNKFGQFQILAQVAQQLQLPLVSLEHTLPVPYWPKVTFENCKLMRGVVNVFISDYSIDRWGWDRKNDTRVIKHCVDTLLFYPFYESPDSEKLAERNNHILTVANDYIGRDWCLNFQQYQRVTKDLPVFPVGDTKGFSQAAPNQQVLLDCYQKSRIFLNTAHISPIPTSLLEAMACACACVSIKASDIPSYIEHGVNGFLAENDDEMRKYLVMLLNDEVLAEQLGKEARNTIVEKCSEARFVSEWNEVFENAINFVYRG